MVRLWVKGVPGLCDAEGRDGVGKCIQEIAAQARGQSTDKEETSHQPFASLRGEDTEILDPLSRPSPFEKTLPRQAHDYLFRLPAPGEEGRLVGRGLPVVSL